MTWVVDASVAIKWVIPEVLSDNADRMRDTDDDVLAPDLLLVEVANTLCAWSTRSTTACTSLSRSGSARPWSPPISASCAGSPPAGSASRSSISEPSELGAVAPAAHPAPQ